MERSQIKKEVQRQIEKISRGTTNIIDIEELEKKLIESISNNRPLIVKAGFDPTAPDIHLGHTVLLNKMRTFQELGHRVIFLIGDFTAMIGDPTGKKKTRPMLKKEEVKENARTYIDQVSKILIKEKIELRFNSEWLSSLNAQDIARLASYYTVGRMLEREDFKKRFKENEPISVVEFLYPLFQAYDSVALRADIELGGHDQLVNLLIGRDVQRFYDQSPQVVITVPLLLGTDARVIDGELVGNKMSKSLGNHIGIDEDPDQMFGKIMSICDELMWEYLELLTTIPLSDIDRWKKEVKENKLNPIEVKENLAFYLVERFHSSESAKKARERFRKAFRERDIPEDIPQFVATSRKDRLIDVLRRANLVTSSSEARRLMSQGAIRLNGEQVADIFVPLEHGEYVLKVGKRRFLKLKVN